MTITSEFNDIVLGGICGVLPQNKVDHRDYAKLFGSDVVEKIIKSSGIQGSYQCNEDQTASDLCYVAAERLIREKNIDRSSIDVVLFVSSYPDYIAPATAFVLQKRLGINKDCIVYDINLGCSGFIYGMYTMASLLHCSNARCGLLLVGDTTSKSVSPKDKTRMLFGDAGAAAYFEKKDEADPIRFALRSDGNRYKSIIIPAGGFRHLPDASHEQTMWGDGNIRSDYNLYMGGPDVFGFSLKDVPELFSDFFSSFGMCMEDYDSLILHQANLFMIKHIAQRLGIGMDKVPVSLDRYGNSSGTTIPITICDQFARQEGKVNLLMSGFGIGLSWGVASLTIDKNNVFEITHSSEKYEGGGVSHG
ncbi:MAG: ketoacyl-ACP synthase III [Oscillospiraceae bacterium]|nr:ketoacyl-ACP synthase III [Oscillospiraceae bacterium]